jgi:hypothetical protein
MGYTSEYFTRPLHVNAAAHIQPVHAADAPVWQCSLAARSQKAPDAQLGATDSRLHGRNSSTTITDVVAIRAPTRRLRYHITIAAHCNGNSCAVVKQGRHTRWRPPPSHVQ